MKIVILLGDGMAGEPLEELGGRTTLEAAQKPVMDALARRGAVGLAHTVPPGYPPGSDVANLSAFGYDPAQCYTGRAPLEALAMGVALGEKDVAYRMNLVSLVHSNSHVFMHDFTAGHITSSEAARIVETLRAELGEERFEFHPGVSYRNLFVWRGGEVGAKTTPPHDITGKSIHEYLPTGPGSHELLGLMTGSQILLKNHPVNLERQEAGKATADSVWLWGQGFKPRVSTFGELYGLTGTVVCAVDLIKGIGMAAGLKCPTIPGATGYLDTDYAAKANAAIEAIKQDDFVFVHVEAPDEAGHAGKIDEKVLAIERFDERVVAPVLAHLETCGEDFRLLVMPDHPTPIRIRTHTSEPVPFIMLEKGAAGAKTASGYTEKFAAATGLVVKDAYKLMRHMAGVERLW